METERTQSYFGSNQWNKNLKLGFFFLVTIVGTLLFLFMLNKTAVPLLLAFFYAYLMMPLVDNLTNFVCSRQGYSNHRYQVRGIISFLILCLGLGLFFLGLILIIPNIFRQAQVFINELPQLLDQLVRFINHTLASVRISYRIDVNQILKRVPLNSPGQIMDGMAPVVTIVGAAFKNIAEIFVDLVNAFVFPFFSYFILKYRSDILAHMNMMVPPRHRSYYQHLMQHIDRILSGFIRGQLLVSFILGIGYSLGLMIVGLQFSWLIGFCSGLLNMIPYVGFAIGLGTALIVSLSQFSWHLVLGILVSFSIVQMIESMLLTPQIVGRKVDLNPFFALLAVMIGGNVGGLAGMFFAIPVAAFLKVVINDLFTWYRSSAFYNR